MEDPPTQQSTDDKDGNQKQGKRDHWHHMVWALDVFFSKRLPFILPYLFLKTQAKWQNAIPKWQSLFFAKWVVIPIVHSTTGFLNTHILSRGEPSGRDFFGKTTENHKWYAEITKKFKYLLFRPKKLKAVGHPHHHPPNIAPLALFFGIICKLPCPSVQPLLDKWRTIQNDNVCLPNMFPFDGLFFLDHL
jgi:hypothetical protein